MNYFPIPMWFFTNSCQMCYLQLIPVSDYSEPSTQTSTCTESELPNSQQFQKRNHRPPHSNTPTASWGVQEVRRIRGSGVGRRRSPCRRGPYCQPAVLLFYIFWFFAERLPFIVLISCLLYIGIFLNSLDSCDSGNNHDPNFFFCCFDIVTFFPEEITKMGDVAIK
jgi:hypothetical protein